MNITHHLEIDGISRRFGNVQALDDVSLSVSRGDVVCLVGHSGCGKSSLLRVIAGIEKPDRGRILLNGQEVSGPVSHVEPENRNIGFMFQDYALFPHLSVTDNILFGVKRLGKRVARDRCDEVIERLGLGRLAMRFPHMLSGGEQQRVALARALAPQPEIMLMDEPFSNLDRELRHDIRTETIDLLRELGTTVIMVTHDPEEALSASDVVVLMRAGRMIQSGTGVELYEHPSCRYAAEFFCSFNRLKTPCRGGYAETPLGKFATPGLADGEQATVYIRPQCLHVNHDGDGVECTVVDCELIGEIEEMSIAVAALTEPLRVRSTNRSGLRKGDKAHVSTAFGRALVF